MAIYPGFRTSPYHKPIDADDTLFYPESDGSPIADNTKQFDWIMNLKAGLDALFADRPDVFVAGDLLWYPVRDDAKTRVAPDVLVVFGQPKGDRGSYIQHREENIPPQVVFEIYSPGNTEEEMLRKRDFYERYEVEEYYRYDPDTYEFEAWIQKDGQLRPAFFMEDWVSPRLGIRFVVRQGRELQVLRPDGRPFLNPAQSEMERRQILVEREQAQIAQIQEQWKREQAEAERNQAIAESEQAKQQIAQAEQRAEAEKQRAEALAARLRELGIDPDELVP